MGRSLGGTLFKLAVAGVALLFVLGVVGTVVGLLVGVLSAVLTAVVVLGLLAIFGAAAVGVLSLLGSGDEAGEGGATDWFDTETDAAVDDTEAEAERLRERYVAGEIDEAEFERRLALVLDDPTADAGFGADFDELERELGDVDELDDELRDLERELGGR